MKQYSGFTLIEVLIAVVLLAGGLLGLAALQAAGLNNNHSAYNRSQATQLAYDIADRMRANAPTAANYQSIVMAPADASCATGNDPCTKCASTASSCTPAELAEKDLFDWNKALADTLPSGAGNIALVGDVYIVTVTWDDDRDGDANNNLSFVMGFRL